MENHKSQTMLEKDFKYYLDNQVEFVKNYTGKILVISNEKLIAAFNTMKEAYDCGVEKCGIGNFIVQRCSPGKTDYTQSFYSRVHFN